MAETLVNKTQAADGIWTSANLIAGTNVSITEVQQPMIDKNTMGVWHFDGNTDNAVIGSGYYFNSDVLAASTTFSSTDKKMGSYSAYSQAAPTTTSAKDIILFPQAIGQGSITVDAWIKVNSSLTFGFGSNYFDYSFVFGSSSKTWFGQYSSTNISSTIFPLNTWNHVALEIEYPTYRWYINGSLIRTATYSGSRAWGALMVTAGGGNYYIDELRISNIARYLGNNFTPFTTPYTYGVRPIYQLNNTQDISGKQDLLSAATGYDATKTQVLKNVAGTLTWVDEA